jgi:hypothetical protein
MLAKAHLILFLATFAVLPALSQVEPIATGDSTTTEDDSQMMTPPPVSGIPYPNMGTSVARTNYFNAGFTGEMAYLDNVLPGETVTPVSSITYSVLSDFSLQKTTSRQTATLRYSPSFIFYEPTNPSESTNQLDSVDHSASLIYQDRLSPHLGITLDDFFLRTSNVFNDSYPFTAGGLTGSSQAPVPALIAPFAEQMYDNADAAINYQFSRNSMVGGGGSYSNFDLPNPAQAVGLSISNGEGATAFYSRRVAAMQYAGLSYDYSRIVAGSFAAQDIEAQTHTLLPFYTIYFTRRFSLSVTGGVQRTTETQAQGTPVNSWSPSVVASMGWQGVRGNLAIDYLYAVTSGQGLYGAFRSDGASASGGWRLSRTWNAGFTFSYNTITALAQLTGLNFTGGTALTAEASLSRTLGEHFTASFGYQRLQENYVGIQVISENPDSDREYGRITYQFKKALGR